MKIIFYSAKFYIINFIHSIFVLALSALGLYYLFGADNWFATVGYGILSIVGLSLLIWTVYELQWIILDKGTVCARNVFGIIKKLELSEIKTAKTIDAYAFGIKMYSKHYSCIAITSRKTLKPCDIKDAYNHKKAYYIVFPNTDRNRQVIQSAYMETTGAELIIK